jgi:hypothetical protein
MISIPILYNREEQFEKEFQNPDKHSKIKVSKESQQSFVDTTITIDTNV